MAVVLCVLILPMACNRAAPEKREPKPLETVDVGGGLDAALSTELDERAKKVEIDMGGVLPSDFPQDMPVFSPSSVVDFGPGFVELDSPVPVGEVRSSLGAQIQRSGWTVESIGDGGSLYSRNGLEVRVVLSDPGSGSRIRYEY
jgi:hypothetical protein